MGQTLAKPITPFGAMMMVTGCCIGAGMIGLPVLSAVVGFLPSFIAILFSYAFTTATGLLLLEASLWFEGRANLMMIAEFALGRIGKVITTLLFLFPFYPIFVSYFDGGGEIFSTLFQIPRGAGAVITLALLSTVFLGLRLI